MQESKIFIILLNWNGAKDTVECLRSLAKIPSPSFQILVVDNGSKDDSVQTIRANYPDIPILETHENLGFAEGNNRGIQWALSKGADWIFLLNNDTIAAPNVLDAFLKASLEKPQAKILGAKIYRYDAPNTIDHLGGYWNPKLAEFYSPAQGKIDDHQSSETMEEVDYVCGAALFVHRSVFETIGLLEPKFFLFWEETDFCMRAKRRGFAVWTAPQAKIWHKVSSSFVGGKPHTHYFWWRSRLLWIKRNCPPQERQQIYQRIIFPELWKSLRHYLLKTLQSFFTKNPAPRRKALRDRAGLAGAFHYSIGRFGNCPSWLIKK